MADQSRTLLLTATTVLMIISFGKVALEQCMNSLENIVVYEGTKDTILSCGASSQRWTVRPTSNTLTDITYFNGTVYPNLTGLYASSQSGLIIHIAISNNTDGPISTAGVYIVYLPDNNRTAAKVVVIRSGPNCSLTQTSPEGASITCTIIYADYPVSPIIAIFNCSADGHDYTATPPRKLITPYVYNSTVTLFINSSSAAGGAAYMYIYCRVTFTAPTNNQVVYMARNEPKFIANVTVALGQCPNPLENIVVYEGTKDTILSCGACSQRWTVRPTSKPTTEVDITYFNGTVYPTLTGLYAFKQSGLIIHIAASNNTDGPISTAGMYYVYLPDNNNTAAAAVKVVVIRSGPNWSLTRTSSEGASITCTIIYADHPVSPMNAIFSCSADGHDYTATPPRTLITPYVYNSTATLFINGSSAAGGAAYNCRVTFTAPTNNKVAYMASNEPKFIAKVTVVN